MLLCNLPQMKRAFGNASEHTATPSGVATPISSSSPAVWSINSQPSTIQKLREYKAVYVLSDAEIGLFSDEVVVNCAP